MMLLLSDFSTYSPDLIRETKRCLRFVISNNLRPRLIYSKLCRNVEDTTNLTKLHIMFIHVDAGSDGIKAVTPTN